MNELWYYAQDGSPKGPVERSVVEALFREGKIQPDTLVWKEGTPDWVAAQSVFASTGSTTAASSETGSGQIDLGGCIQEGWTAFKQHWILLVAGTAIFLAISIFIQAPFSLAQIFLERVGGDAAAVATVAVIILGWGVSLVVSPPLNGGIFYFTLETLRDRPRIESLFVGFKKENWLQLVLGSLVILVFILLGLLLLIIPGIYLAIAYYYTIPLIVDRKLGFWEAMELSRKTVHQQWVQVFALVLLTGFIAVVGVLLCCVGVLAALPLGYLIAMQGYRQLFVGTGTVPTLNSPETR
jgi:hypothetical protein